MDIIVKRRLEMRRTLLMTMLLLLTPSVSNSKEVKIGSGWNLIGTACEISVSELDKKGIRTVWLWDRDKAFWRAWSPDNRTMEIIDSYGLILSKQFLPTAVSGSVQAEMR